MRNVIGQICPFVTGQIWGGIIVGRHKMAVHLFRFRISTALIAVALIGFPFAVLWIQVPNPFQADSTLSHFHSWLFFDLSPSLFGIGFIASLVTAIVLVVKRQWQSIPQCLIEMVVCVICVTLIPAY